MWLDASLAYFHFTAVFVFFAFMSMESWLLRTPVDATRALELRRADQWYWGSIAVVLATGIVRLLLGAKGAGFYLHSVPAYAKLLLFAAVAFLSLAPRATFLRWSREAAGAPHWMAADADRLGTRRRLMATLHLAALLPLAAALMARGLP